MTTKRQALRDEVEKLILNGLTTARWNPGSRLSIDGIARDLKMSPTPVREAMVSLAASGLVEYEALRGFVVAPMLDAQQITELLAARKIIESSALTAAFNHWEEFSKALSVVHKEHADVIARVKEAKHIDFDLVREHFATDWKFHLTLFIFAKNRYLTQAVEDLHVHTYRMRQTLAGGPHVFDAHDAHSEHGEILKMVQCERHDGAQAALAAHLDGVLVRSIQALDYVGSDVQ